MLSSSAGGALRWGGGAGGRGQRPEEPEVWLSAAALLPPPRTHDQSSGGGGGQVHLHRCVFLPVVWVFPPAMYSSLHLCVCVCVCLWGVQDQKSFYTNGVVSSGWRGNKPWFGPLLPSCWSF